MPDSELLYPHDISCPEEQRPRSHIRGSSVIDESSEKDD